MSQTTTQVARGRRQLDYLPISLFGSVMGLTGLSVAWRSPKPATATRPGWRRYRARPALVAFVAMLGYAMKLPTA